jgi:hypothetical protein
MPRPKIYRDNAAKQRAYRRRKKRKAKLMNVQPTIFDAPHWKDEWKGMPEFVQEAKPEPYAEIIFRVATEEDLEALAKATGQTLTERTKSAWFPRLVPRARKKYVHES